MYTIATDNVLWKKLAVSSGAQRYIQTEDENKPFCYYRAVNSFVLNIELPPISGDLVWRNPLVWFPGGEPKQKKFLNPDKWK